MKINILLLICFSFLINSCYLTPVIKEPNQWADVIPEFKNRAVRLYVFDNNGNSYYRGSGVIYDGVTVLTSSHIYARADSTNQRTIFCHRFEDSVMYQLYIIKKDFYKDGLMLLQTQAGYKFSNIDQVLPLGNNTEGSEACMCGSSDHLATLIKYGRTSLIENIYNITSIPSVIKFSYQDFLFFDIHSSFKGNSGSPLYNQQGELVGIYWGEIRSHGKILVYCAVSADNIKKFLRKKSADLTFLK